ncbi:MAG: arsenate reductase ArsC [Planctomycetota bacterium]|jgi:arsenate reductase
MRPLQKVRILFLCTGNSCRSQMAEGWARHLKAETIEAYSAGIEARGLDPTAVQAMAEAGVDISTQRSKHLEELAGVDLDYVVTVCDRASELCPTFPGKTKVIHVGFDDPPELAKRAESEEEMLVFYRRVRDEIKAFVLQLPDRLAEEEGGQR